METENEALAGLLDSHLGPMVAQLRAIPPDKWEWTPVPSVPSPHTIAVHTWHWLISDRRHVQEPDIMRHPLISEAPAKPQVLCDALDEENRTWRDLILALTPEQLGERRFQFGVWPHTLRYIVAHVTQQVIYKHGQLSLLFFWLGLDGDEPYQAPFPNDDYAKLHQALENPLHRAVLTGDADAVQRELATGPNLALPIAMGHTLLQLAVLHEHPCVVSLLLEAGADGNETDSDGNTPLLYACFTGSTAAAQALIAHGVDIHKTNRWGGDAFGFAQMKNNHELMALLSQAVREKRSEERS